VPLKTISKISIKLRRVSKLRLSLIYCILKRLRNAAFRSFPHTNPLLCLHMGWPDAREIKQTLAAVIRGRVELTRFPSFDPTHQNTLNFYCFGVYCLLLPLKVSIYATSFWSLYWKMPRISWANFSPLPWSGWPCSYWFIIIWGAPFCLSPVCVPW
jgi:hypothetical protein